MGMLEDDECCPWVRQAGCEIRCLRDNFVHHWQRATFRLLGEEEAVKPIERTCAEYEAK